MKCRLWGSGCRILIQGLECRITVKGSVEERGIKPKKQGHRAETGLA